MMYLSDVDDWKILNVRRKEYFRREPQAVVIIPNLFADPPATAETNVEVASGDHYLFTRVESPFAQGGITQVQISILDGDKPIASQQVDLPAGGSEDVRINFRPEGGSVTIRF